MNKKNPNLNSKQAKEIFQLFFRTLKFERKPLFSKKIYLKPTDKWFITDADFKELIDIAEKEYSVDFEGYFNGLGFSHSPDKLRVTVKFHGK